MAKGPPFAPALRAAASRTWRCGVYSSSGRAGAERSAGARPAFASKGKKDLALQNRPRYLAGVFPRTGLARQLVAQLLGRDALRAPSKGAIHCCWMRACAARWRARSVARLAAVMKRSARRKPDECVVTVSKRQFSMGFPPLRDIQTGQSRDTSSGG